MNTIYKPALLLLPFLLVFGLALKFRPSSPPALKIIFKSTDGGQTWQDISEGLPEKLRKDGIRGESFFVNDKGLFLSVENGIYHSTPNATAPFWTKEISAANSSIAPGKYAISSYNYWGVNLKKRNGTGVWSPIFKNSQEQQNSSAFETAGGTIYISTGSGLFKTANNGKTWKHVYAGDWVRNMAEWNGVLMATTNMRRIIRSTDNGENWTLISAGDVTWDVKQVEGGFAAITSSSEWGTRRLRTSFDGGETWQPVTAGLKDKIQRTWNNDRLSVQAFNTSIIQVGENLIGADPHGIFRSSDEGKTWKLLLPSIDKKFFSLFVSGNVIYAIARKGGC